MNPLLSRLTPLERKYLKLYAQAARKDYNLLRDATALMQPNDLGLTCAIHACKVAEELATLHSLCVVQLAMIANRHKLRRKTSPPYPTDDDLTALVAASFFKVVAVIPADNAENVEHKDAGWFSGDSNEWQENLLALKAAWGPPKQESLSTVLLAFAQLFYLAAGNKLPFMNKYHPSVAQPEDDWYDDEQEDLAEPEDFD